MALLLPPAMNHFLDEFSLSKALSDESNQGFNCALLEYAANAAASHRLNSARVSLVENVAFQLQFLHRRSVPYILYGGLRTNLSLNIAPSPPTTRSWSLRLSSRSARARRRLALSALPSLRSARLYVHTLSLSHGYMMHNIPH